MARKIKFPLKMADGAEVRTLEELKEHFDVESVVAYFKDGRLLNWLQARYYYDEADKVEHLTDDGTLTKNLCAIFGVESEVEDLDVEEIARRQERLNRLKQYTYDRDILERVNLVAFDQEELGDLLDEDATLIYLCNNRFTIPLCVTHKNYVGVGKAIAVIRSNKIVDFDALNIQFRNVIFDDNYAALLKERELAEENKIAAEKRRAEEQRAAEEAARPQKLFDEGNGALEDEDYETALEKFKAAAELGFSRAFSSVGSIYNFGWGVDIDIDEARRWYKLGMEKGDGDSFGGYATSLLYEGEPTESDKREAFRCMKRATEIGAASEEPWWDDLGDMYRDGTGTRENISEAIRCYEKGVELGNSYSAISLGDFYFYGKGVDQNYYKAFKFCKQAVDLDGDNMRAVRNLAACYRYGYGIDKDEYKAFELYKRAAQAGDADAMCTVGYMLFSGKGVREDKQASFTWTKKAAEASNCDAMLTYANEIYANNKRDYRLIEMYTTAANAGYGEAAYRLSVMYRKGYGTFMNDNSAKYWTQKYKELGYTPNQNVIDAVNGNSGSSNSGNSGGGCFITTAICENLGKPDDCYELTTFRNFRDGWLTAQSDGKSLIAEYYAVAPAIVDKINRLPDAAQAYDNLRRKYLVPCLNFIEQGDNLSCKRLYVEMVTSLKKNFLGD